MKNLMKEAKELGIKFDEDIEKDDLQKLVDEKKEEIDRQNNDVEYLKKELKKYKDEAKAAFEKRDIFKKDKDKLSKKVKDLEDKMKNMTDSETFSSLKEQFESLRQFKEDLDKKNEEEKLKKMDEIERVKLESRKEAENLQRQMDELKKTLEEEKKKKEEELEKERKKVAKLRKSTLDVKIMEAAVRHNAWSPSQIVKLTKNDFVYDDQLDKYSFIKRDDKGKLEDELTIDEYISEYLSKEENENLVKSEANPQSFNSDKDEDKNKNRKPFASSKYNPKDPDIVKQAEDRDMTPERYIRTLEKRDSVMEERKKVNEE